MAVQAGLADEELETAPERLAQPLDLLAQLGHLLATDCGGLADPGRGAVLAERLAERLRPLAGGGAGAGGGDRGRHDVLAVLGGHPGQLGERLVSFCLIAPRAPGLDSCLLVGLDLGIDDQDPTVRVGRQRRRLGRGELVHPDDGQLAGLDPPPALAM